MSTAKTVVLGDEHDEDLRTALRRVLRELGAHVSPGEFAVGGSQELSSQRVELRGELLIVEAETYVGLSLSGPAEMVDEVVAAIRRRRKPGDGTHEGG